MRRAIRYRKEVLWRRRERWRRAGGSTAVAALRPEQFRTLPGSWHNAARHFVCPAAVSIEEILPIARGLDFANPCAEWPLVVPSKLRVRPMPVDQPRAAENPFEEPDDIDEAALTAVLRTVPLGAAVLAGGAVALLVLGYLIIYLLIFLPRGVVG
jgi:hypothetical protein